MLGAAANQATHEPSEAAKKSRHRAVEVPAGDEEAPCTPTWPRTAPAYGVILKRHAGKTPAQLDAAVKRFRG
jgi:hypothetical protein